MADTERHNLEKPRPDKQEYVLRRYEKAIDYYWRVSKANKRWYKRTRYLTVVLGALVTLLASLSSSDLMTEGWSTSVGLITPIGAAVLTIVGGLSQTFQWGAAWQEMVLTAERLERERDRIIVTDSDAVQDLDVLNRLVIEESRGFFTRILGAVRSSVADEDTNPGER
jgi:hypothetical protein